MDIEKYAVASAEQKIKDLGSDEITVAEVVKLTVETVMEIIEKGVAEHKNENDTGAGVNAWMTFKPQENTTFEHLEKFVEKGKIMGFDSRSTINGELFVSQDVSPETIWEDLSID